MQPQYRTWKDNGDNVGVQCLVCDRTRWNESDPTTNWITGQPCSNCEALHTNGILAIENQKHQQELAQYQSNLAAAQTPEEKAAVILNCSHTSTQPVQANPFSA